MRVLIAALLTALMSPVSAQQGTETVEALTVTVGVSHAPPYWIVQGQERAGLYVEIFEAIADRLGWDVRYREAPFRRILRMVQQGEVDVMLGPTQTEDKANLMEFVAPAFPPERRLFFYLNEEHSIQRYADLHDRVVGVLEGASYFSRFDHDEELLKEPAPRYENLMLMMEKGRVDVVIAPELVGLYVVKRLGLDAKVSPFFMPGERSYIAVAKNSPAIQYADDIRAALKLIELEGIHEDLVLKYMDRNAE